MGSFLPKTSYYDVFRHVFKKEVDSLNEWCDNMLLLFNTPNIRLLVGQLQNPTKFRPITLQLDGHDSRVSYQSIYEIGLLLKKHLYSFKLKKSGARTQLVLDTNNFFIHVSDSEPCGINNDGSHLMQMRIYNWIGKHDCMQMDSVYRLFLARIVALCHQNGRQEINSNQFIFPIRRLPKKPLDMSEDNYNERFGACRSRIETQFSEFEQKFGLFGPTKVMCITNMKVYNVMFKVAIVLYNFYRAETVFEDYIDILPKHEEWTTVNFDFLYNGEIGLEEEIARVEFEHQRITAMQNSQH